MATWELSVRLTSLFALFVPGLWAHWASAQQPGVSSAQAIRVAVEFAAPEGCSERASFEAGLRSRFERLQIVEPKDALFRLNVKLLPIATGIHGQLRLTDERGDTEVRTMDGQDCPHVVEALSLTAALAIEQTVTLDAPAPTTGATDDVPLDVRDKATNVAADSSAPMSTSRDVSAADGRSEVRASPEPRRAWRAGAGLLVTNLIAPQTLFGASVRLGRAFDWERFIKPMVGLGVTYIPRDRPQLQGRLRVGYVALQADVCPTLLQVGANVVLFPCLQVEQGRLTVEDRESDVVLGSRRWETILGVAARGEVALGSRGLLEFSGVLEAPTVHRQYVTLSPWEQVGETRSVAVRLGAGGGFRF